MRINIGTSANGNPCLEFTGLPDDSKSKLATVASVLQMALSDNKVTPTEYMMIAIALGSVLSK